MTFPSYPQYRDSGVEWLGDVPEHWELLPLKHFAEVDNSGCYGVEPADGVHIRPVATTAQIDSEGRFDVGRMSDRGFSAQELARYECSPGDVLVVKSSGSAENIISGKAGLVRNDTPPFVFSNFLMRLRHRKDVCLPSFLYSLLISHLTRERIKQMCSTTTYPNLQVGLYTSAKLPCPSLNEQSQIARFLDHETARIDALIEEQQRLIELLKEKRQAVISHAVTKGLDPTAPMKDSGVEWLGEVPAHWEVLRIGAVYSETADKGLAELPVLRVSIHYGVSDKELSEEESDRKITRIDDREKYKRVCPGDLVYNMMRAWQGGFGAVLVDGLVSPAYVVARPKIGDISRYVEQLLRTSCAVEEMRKNSYGITDFRLRLYWDQFKNISIVIPPEVERQRIMERIDSLICESEALKNEADQLINILQERRSALISAAVTGKIDVRGWQPPASARVPELEVAEAV